MSELQNYFAKFRDNTIGSNCKHSTVYGEMPMIYADWIASGRLYAPIEEKISKTIGPFVANTHTESSTTGTLMTNAYHHAKQIIKKHVNAGPDDVLITPGFGMTAAIVKLQRIIGLKLCGKVSGKDCLDKADRPVVFITHMEHHSNHTSWYETVAEVVIVEPDKDLLVDLNDLEKKLIQYKDRKVKFGSFTACSNVTGVHTPYHKMAALMHKYGGWCFIDFAASAPYEDINMHPENEEERLDGIFFSPHKFLGGPGSSGVLIFNKALYNSKSPDHPGGGTVEWTNPWGEYQYLKDIEAREDGGTPGFLQAIRTALAIQLKEEMGAEKIIDREKELLKKAFAFLDTIPNLRILASNVRERLGVISFYVENVHYNLIVKLLSDRYGIQVRGGCACAGTYGHFLLNVSHEKSNLITEKITSGDLSEKPGWVRLSLHPTMTDAELEIILIAIKDIAENHREWGNDYSYDNHSNEFYNRHPIDITGDFLSKIFGLQS
jgi:selenocysteine lyase/cysteine desulfurase